MPSSIARSVRTGSRSSITSSRLPVARSNLRVTNARLQRCLATPRCARSYASRRRTASPPAQAACSGPSSATASPRCAGRRDAAASRCGAFERIFLWFSRPEYVHPDERIGEFGLERGPVLQIGLRPVFGEAHLVLVDDMRLEKKPDKIEP